MNMALKIVLGTVTRPFGLDGGCTTAAFQAQGCNIEDLLQNSFQFFSSDFFLFKYNHTVHLLPLHVKVVQWLHWRRWFSLWQELLLIPIAGRLAHPQSYSQHLPWQEQFPALSFTTTLCVPALGPWVPPRVTVTHFPHHTENPCDGSETQLHSQHLNATLLCWMDLIAVWRL